MEREGGSKKEQARREEEEGTRREKEKGRKDNATSRHRGRDTQTPRQRH